MRLLILDRDGVLNEDSPDYIRSPDEWKPLPGSLEAVARLSRAGWTVVVATNQSGVARGLLSADTLDRIHTRMTAAVAAAGGRIAAIYVCPHGPADGCPCRKPEPGLLLKAAAEWRVEPNGVPAVGDSLRDLEAAWRVNARAILVRTGNGRRTEQSLRPGAPVEVYDDLAAVAERLLKEEK